MRFSIAPVSAFVAVAFAQSSTTSAPASSKAASPTTADTATSTTPLTPVQSCLNNCQPGDVYCQASCVGVPYPGSVQTNQTTECVANCDQGDGTASANLAYAACRNKCISSFILTTTLGTEAESTATAGGGFAGLSGAQTTQGFGSATGGASGSSASATGSGSGSGSSASPSGSGSGSGSGSDSGSASGSSSGSASAVSSSGAAYSHVQAGSAVGGLVGLIMAVLAL